MTLTWGRACTLPPALGGSVRSGTRVRHRPSQTASRLSANKPPTGRALGKRGVRNRAVCRGPRPQASFVGRCDRVTTFSQTDRECTATRTPTAWL